MAYEKRPLTGALFRNTKKEKDTHPDHTGNIVMEDGSEYFLDAWIKETKSDPPRKFFSLSLKRKERQTGQQKQPQQPSKPLPTRRPPPADPDLDQASEDEIPF